MCRARNEAMTHEWGILFLAISVLSIAGCGDSAGGPSDAGVGGPSLDGAGGRGDDGQMADADEPLDARTDGDDVRADGPKTVAAHVPLLHRASATTCSQPRPAGSAHSCYGYPDAGGCRADQDCTAGANGRCVCGISPAVAANAARCSYDDCASDGDCNGGVCDCRESPAHITWGTQTVCLGGNCKTDSDCGSDGYCSPSPIPGCGGQSWHGYYCHTPGDQCIDDSDCNEANAYCAYDPSSSRWVCSTGMCIDG
jgi:hypothetical protein